MNRPADLHFGASIVPAATPAVTGRLVDMDGDTFYVIDDAQALAPFFISVVSDSDHWLFAASTGALTAGRGSPAHALFPYVTEDKIVDSAGVTGPITALLVTRDDRRAVWHPFVEADRLAYRITRRLAKNVLGNRLVFEEDNHDLGLTFRAEWRTSDGFGFVRTCTLTSRAAVTVRILDGLLDLLPGDVSEPLQLGYSCLVDAFKMHARVPGTTLALYTLAAQVVDRAEPVEALHATTVWSHGLAPRALALVDDGRADFDRGHPLVATEQARGRRGAYLLEAELQLAPGAAQTWRIIADVQRTQADAVALVEQLRRPDSLAAEVEADLARGDARLREIVAATDGLQRTADPLATAHHAINVLFNDMRGGVFADNGAIPGPDFARFVRAANREVWSRHRALLAELPARAPRAAHQARVDAQGDPDLSRLAAEYLPLTFSRRHGDPSRPWNRFDIRVKDEHGAQRLDYQGNWRDIFQNWEALCASSPEFLEPIVAKFVNASTIDGHNPYRIGRGGLDWEVPEPDHPWSTIGYWGDHQIVYLLRLLEAARAHHPDRLGALLEQRIFTYADVPYQLRGHDAIVADPRATIVFDAARHARISARVIELGADARLVHDAAGIVHVNLIEKLLVPALAKLASFVPGGGIWMNTQRPEWNDANNALVGYGVSMVTACYLERYLAELPVLLAPRRGHTTRLSTEVATWLAATAAAFGDHAAVLAQEPIDDGARGALMETLGRAAEAYRAPVYRAGFSGTAVVEVDAIVALAARARGFLTHTIAAARRADGLVHAYGVLVPRGAGRFGVEFLAEMLEGQVAALACHALDDQAALALLDALPASRLYRADQHSYLLYPDRQLPGFLDKNVIPDDLIARTPVLARWLAADDPRIVLRDAAGHARFHADLATADACAVRLQALRAADELPEGEPAIGAVLAIYEQVFRHRAFTGRSGAMFAYEGLGSIYWHMVGKLLLAVQERYVAAAEAGAAPALLERLARHYEAIRAGMSGVEKSPSTWGAFPLDPYSHSPAHSGARQPGMTGQVKEEILIRLGELGVRVKAGRVTFAPRLLRRREFLTAPAVFEPIGLDGARGQLALPVGALAFTYCQVPVVYHLGEVRRIVVTEADGGITGIAGDTLDAARAAALFERRGQIVRLDVHTQPGRP
jgi:hypothetical protein